MIEPIRRILEGTLDRLSYHVTTYLPSILAALVFVVGAYLMAVGLRWFLYKVFKGPALDKFLRQSGIAFMVDPSGRLRATRLVAEAVYWCMLLAGLLIGLSVFKTDITTQIVQGFVFLLPKLVIAGLILLGGAWLSRYLGRSVLVWAVNENVPSPRRLAAAVRVVIVFVAVVVAANQLDFAKNVFLAAFVILVGGAVLAAGLAVGLGASTAVRELLQPKKETSAETSERSVLSHL
jgi:hypothetical protein